MVNFYCRACGLYISVPAEYSGGRGVCPRCKTPLRIPRSLPENHPDFVAGLRYLADLFNTSPVPPTERPPIATREFGPSSLFKCNKCGREFESLRSTGVTQGQCPNCGVVCPPMVATVDFPRDYASNAQTPAVSTPEKGGWIMDGDFLVAPRSADQDPSDSIIQGLPLQPGDLNTPASSMNGPQKCTPDIEAQLEASLSPKPVPVAVESADSRQWFYLLREHQHGPVSTAKLQNLIQSGKVGLSVLVFHEGLKGWRPIEEFEELSVCAKAPETHEPPAETPPPATLTLQELRRLHNKFLSLLWLFVAAGCIFTLGLVMKQSLRDLGQAFFFRANMTLSFLIFLGIVYGAVLLYRRWKLFRRAPLSIRLRTWIGLGGLLVCMVTTLALPLGWRDEGKAELDQDSIVTAQRVYSVLRTGKVQASYVIVNWRQLRVNGEEYGEKFHNANSEDDRQKLMDSVCNVFLAAFEPYYNRLELNSPAQISTWRVADRGAGDTVVQVRIPSTGKQIRFTLRANNLIAMDVQ